MKSRGGGAGLLAVCCLFGFKTYCGPSDLWTFMASNPLPKEAAAASQEGEKSSVSEDTPAKEKKWPVSGLVATVYYIAIVLLFGVPIWIKTTSPVRYPLPDISNLMVHSQMISHKIPVTIVVTDPDKFGENERSSLRQQLTQSWPKRTSSDGSFSFVFEWKVRPIVPEEETVFSNYTTLSDIDNYFGSIQTHAVNGRIWIYLIDQYLTSETEVMYGSHRFVYMTSSENDDKSLAERIISVVDVMLEPLKSTETEIDTLSAPESKGPENELLLDPEIEVYVNFILEDPHDRKTFQDHKKFKEALALMHSEFLIKSGVRQLLDLKISSQMVYHSIDQEFVASIATELADGPRVIHTRNMAILLNNIESRVVEPNNVQSHNLHVIIPAANSKSLFFTDGNLNSNLVMAASRGGFIIWNEDLDFNVGFKVFMRSLMGLNQVLLTSSVKSDIFFSKWELDFVMRSASQKQILKTLQSLESVEKLLGKMNSMVIEEDVSKRMNTAVDISHESIDDLASGRLETAYVLSSKAYVLSEKAFFDPSLLALLYFPEDQKYAVYFPLFLPISLPILSSLYHLLKHFFNKRTKTKLD